MSRYFTTSDWVEMLGRLAPPGALLSTPSFQALTGLNEKAVRQALWRLNRKGIVTHVGGGWYTHAFAKVNLDEIAAVLVRPSYVSLETVLGWTGATTQPSAELTCITTAPSQLRQTPYGPIRYRSLARRYFWGFDIHVTANGLYTFHAHPEKALLDLLHLTSLSGGQVWLDLDFSRFDERRLNEYAEAFPSRVGHRLQQLRQLRLLEA
jgi:predicted transcriptional regulator of viral defense system